MRASETTIRIHLQRRGYNGNDAQIKEIVYYLDGIPATDFDSTTLAIEEAIDQCHWELVDLQREVMK